MRFGHALLALSCASCNWVFTLDKADQVEGDFDFDGDDVPNARDNCPTVNNDQSDIDDDGVGDACDPCTMLPGPAMPTDGDGDDACDPCLLGPSHDEDGDGVFDACDNCPSWVNPDQTANMDNDDLGDACDSNNASPQHRVLFDGFADLAGTWRSLDLWKIANDSAVPLGPPNDVANHELWDPARGAIGATRWRIEIGFVPPTMPAAAAIGIHAMDQAHRFLATSYVQWTGANYIISVPGGFGVLPALSGPIAFRVQGEPNPDGSNNIQITAEVVGLATAVGTTPLVLPESIHVEMRTQSTPIQYVDFIRD